MWCVFEVVKLFFEGAIVPLILGYSKLIVATEKARDTFFDFAENLKKIPILGALFAPLLAAISLVRDLTQNASATFAGFRAAAEQAVQNVKNYFNDLVLTAQIAAVRIQKALAISDSAEAFYQKQIDGLNAQKTALATSGKTVAEAYTIARNNALLNGTIKNQEEENQRRKKKENNDTELDAKAEKAAETARKKAFDAKLKGIEADSARLQVFLEKDRLEGIINETEYQTTLAQIKREEYSDQLDAIKAFYGAESLEFQKKSLELQKLNKDEKKAILEIELKAIEQAGVDKKQFAESEFLQNLSTEKEYQRQLLVIDIQTQEQRLARLRTFSDAQTSDVITAENKILKAKSDIKKLDDQANKQLFDDAFLELSDRIDGEIDLLEEGYETEERLLNQKFVTAMLTEQDYEIQKLEAKKALVEAEIAILEGGGEKELKTVKAKNKELLKIDDEIAKKTVENEKRTQAAKRKLLGEGAAAAEGFFSLAVDLLGRDEAARKKNANTIKAFQKAEVITKGIVEVAKIFESYSTIPFAGPVIAAVNAGLAVGRTVVAVNRINQTQFAEGGYTGDGFWRDATGYRVAGVVHEGEWVAPKWMVENPNYAPLFQNLEQKRYKGFAEGGFVTQSTAPVGATTLFQNTPQNTQNQSFYTDFLSAIALLRQDVQNVKGNLKAVIFRNEYEAQAKADANDRSKATI